MADTKTMSHTDASRLNIIFYSCATFVAAGPIYYSGCTGHGMTVPTP